MPGGGFLALVFAPPALALFGWRALWIVVAAFALLCAALLVRFVPASAPARQTRALHLLTDTLTSPGAVALSVAFICYVGQWASIMTWLPTFAVDERGASESTAALLTAAFVVMNIPGVQLGGMLLKRGTSRGGLLAGGALAMAAMTALFLSAAVPDAVRIACVLAFSLVGGVIPVAVFSGAAAHAKSSEHIGTTNGLVMQASHLSQFVVPIFVAWVASRAGGWSGSLAAMLSLAAIGTLAGAAIGGIERR
jgi:fucose permease